MVTINIPVKDLTKNNMQNNPEPIRMQILQSCEDIDFIDDLLPANEELEQFFINL